MINLSTLKCNNWCNSCNNYNSYRSNNQTTTTTWGYEIRSSSSKWIRICFVI